MDAYEPFLSVAVALALGFVIGVERERSNEEEGATRGLGGARTFPLFALAGSLSTLAGRELGWWFVGVTFTIVCAPIVLAYLDDLRNDRDRGLTSEVAFVLTFLLGVLAQSERVFATLQHKLTVVASIGVALATLLSAKAPLHGFVRQLSRDDIYAAVKFLVVSVILLPLLPDRAMGPYEALNPRRIGWMVVLIAGIGFLGYVLVRALGSGRELGIVGLVGGMVSSTAVTLAMSERARRDPGLSKACAVAVLLASGMMVVRLGIVLGIANRSLLPHIAWPLGALALGTFAVGWFLFWRIRSEPGRSESGVELENPFELRSALKFGALFALLLVASKAAMVSFGDAGTYFSAAVLGTTDVDAISLSVADLAREGLSPTVASTSILIAVAANTLVKAAIAVAIGGWRQGRWVLFGFGVGLCAAVLLLYLRGR